jgi:hypothetical protein
MQLEDQAYRDWKAWAIKETQALKQLQGAAYTGAANEENEAVARVEELVDEDGGTEVEGRRAKQPREREKEESNVREVAESVPGSRRGVQALGGEGVHP